MFLAGVLLAFYGLALPADTELPARTFAPKTVAVLAASAVSVGLSIFTYSVYGFEQPLWNMKESLRSRNGLAVTFLCLGALIISFDVVFIILWKLLGVSIGSIFVHLIVVCLSVWMLLSGYFARPRLVFAGSDFEETPRRDSIFAGEVLLVVGVVLQAMAIIYGAISVIYNETVSPLFILWALIVGFICEFAGFGEMNPMGRWWVQRGNIK